MASDNKASYARIGFTVFVAVAAIIGTLVYLGGIRDRGDESLIETYYDKGVSGLSVGSAVNLRGVKIGEVREISFIGVKYPGVSELDAVRIYVKMAISHRQCGIAPDDLAAGFGFTREHVRRMVEKGLRATVSSSGITGLSRIELDFRAPGEASPIEKIAWTPDCPFVPPQASLLESFSDSATKVMNQINRMDLNAAWSNISHSVESLSRAMDSARTMMETRQTDVNRVFDDFSEAMRSVRELTSELKRNPSLLIRERSRRPLAETER